MTRRREAGKRNRERTEEEIQRALEDQIREEGMLRTGINAVAKRADVSKELIYRYFGGMDGLFMAMMQSHDYWTKAGDIPSRAASRGMSPADTVLLMLTEQMDSLRANEVVQEVRRWELLDADETRQKLAKRREQLARGFIENIAADHEADTVDVPAITGILLAGVLYLVLRSKTEDQFLGVSLRDEEGWERFRNALETIVQSAFPPDLRDAPRSDASKKEEDGEYE
ncbi:TetR/AcrR family transcriptional regulator [Kaustia mangrovi]|uniref:TetR/AcrR family transcriptional regulator n=1 Tax=Kaustia mangrovi TaxID=2593653 RepID=A0A7S8C717_9HYPH|nr:TetR/AcrR family transcriptional regulator [Kaustia mangrovi]QPC44359.1 TetR/AcrR family transcriptional regulator [Kaustia mangrovi]